MIRISGYITEELKSEIDEVCLRENRKFTPMISLLLEYAIKEKTRRRSKKVHTESYSPDLGEGDSK